MVQLDQWPQAAVAEKLIERSLSLGDVRSKQSRMASPNCRALWLRDRWAGGPRDAFIDGHEFCHLQPLPEGGIVGRFAVTSEADAEECSL